jgi:glycosyltransferase involved in cell wall biosynthesis
MVVNNDHAQSGSGKPRTPIAVIIPAYNEEGAIGSLMDELHEHVPAFDVVVISDGSVDNTAALARKKGAVVLDLPCNLGVGDAVQVGIRYAYEREYHFVVRIDGDGQHPPSEIPKLIEAIQKGGDDLVIGSRFMGKRSYTSTPLRWIGLKLLALFLSIICRSRIKDPASGFWIINRKLMYCFAHYYPTEYPEPEAIALLRRYGYSFSEQAVAFRPRITGRSSIHMWGTFFYAVKVGLALVVDRIRPIDPRFEKANVRNIL